MMRQMETDLNEPILKSTFDLRWKEYLVAAKAAAAKAQLAKIIMQAQEMSHQSAALAAEPGSDIPLVSPDADRAVFLVRYRAKTGKSYVILVPVGNSWDETLP